MLRIFVTENRERECHMKKEEIGMKQQKPMSEKNCQNLGERHGTDLPFQPSDDANPANTLILDF